MDIPPSGNNPISAPNSQLLQRLSFMLSGMACFLLYFEEVAMTCRGSRQSCPDGSFEQHKCMMRRRLTKINRPVGGSKLRILFHVIIALLGWGLFIYFWTVVRVLELSRGITVAFIGIGIFTGLLVIVTSWWVVHNLRIASHDRRKTLPEVEDKPYEVDKMGNRVIIGDPSIIKEAIVVDIIIDGDKKIFRPRSLPADLDVE